MIFGLTRAGLGAIGSDEQLIESAEAYGFQSVDGDPTAFVERHGKEGAASFLASRGVQWSSFGLPVDWRTTEEAFRADLPKLIQAAEAAAALHCTACCTYVLPSTDELPAPFLAKAVRRLRICAEILDSYGIRLGLEYVGPHHLRTQWKYPFLWTQEDMLDMIAAIGKPNVGLLVDSYHWYTTGLTAEDLAKLQPQQIVHVHINDCLAKPEEALDNDRVYPGEGVIDLAAFLRSLQQAGYEGAVTQEVLTPAPPQETPEQLLERSRSGLQKVLAAAGLA
jgi:sugar phosphate isomerase/epimerase